MSDQEVKSIRPVPSMLKFSAQVMRKELRLDVSIGKDGLFVSEETRKAYSYYMLGREFVGRNGMSHFFIGRVTDEGVVLSTQPKIQHNLDSLNKIVIETKKTFGGQYVVFGMTKEQMQMLTEAYGDKPIKFRTVSNDVMKKDKPSAFFELHKNFPARMHSKQFQEAGDDIYRIFTEEWKRQEKLGKAPDLRILMPKQDRATHCDQVAISLEEGKFYQIGHVQYVQVTYLEYGGMSDQDEPAREGEKPHPMFYTNNSQYFSIDKVADAIKCAIGRARSEHPARAFGESEKLEDIRNRQTGKFEFESHYTYLDAMLEPFWNQAFSQTPDEMYCAGIVGAHGDKCYSYRDQWEKEGIPFHVGALLYLLTYTKAFEDNEKSNSCQWVIDNYYRYYMRIQAAQVEAFSKRYGVPGSPRLRLMNTGDNLWQIDDSQTTTMMIVQAPDEARAIKEFFIQLKKTEYSDECSV